MSFSYLKDKPWSQITREERYFCSHLYHFLIGKEKEFISWLNEILKTQFLDDQEWEISYEVCFYRDFYKEFPNTEKPLKNLRKRTFDLVLFSESDIIIIEAKVQQPFKKEQIKELKNDVKNLLKLLEAHDVNIAPLLLCSQKYLNNLKKYGDSQLLKGLKTITWNDLFVKYDKEIFSVAEDKYKK